MTRVQAAGLKVCIVLAVMEGMVRALSGVGAIRLPPADLSGFDRIFAGEDAPLHKRLYQADRNLIFRLRPDVDTSYERLIVFPGGKASYHVRTNAQGFRTPTVSLKKPAGVFRIVCLGDSTTFGFNVEEVDTYPRVLERLLAEANPGRRFEVLNFGVPGYSSRQGLELIRQDVLQYEPDLVTFAFGTNDRFWRRPLTDDEIIALKKSVAGGLVIAVQTTLDHFYAYRLLKRAVAEAVYRFADRGAMERQAGQLRVPLDGITNAIVAARAELQKLGAALIVLNNDLFGTDAARAIATGASKADVPYLDMHDLLASKRREHTREIELAKRLPPPQPQRGTLLRVQTKEGMQEVVVEDGAMFATSVDRLPMRDDGKGGDQVAGDGIWSAYVSVKKGVPRTYQYWARAGSELAPEFQCKAGFHTTRRPTVDGSGIGDIDTFGQISLHSDSSHPDEEGHVLIARELLPYVLAAERQKLN